MTDIKYIDIYRKTHDHNWIRRKIVFFAKENGIKPTARHFHCSKNTVKKWLKRYKENPRKKLNSKSTKPKSSPFKMEIYWEATVVSTCEDFKNKHKRINSCQLKRFKSVPYSIKTIKKVMNKYGFSKLNKRKHVRKKDLWAIKKKMKAFQKIQVDLKYLDDIPEFYSEYVKHDLPRYQYTARCVKTGALFIAYAQQISVANTSTFIHLLAQHLKKYGVRLKNKIIQTDNGVEFIHGWNNSNGSNFTKTVEKYSMRHFRIPPGACTYNSDVETSHRLIEDDFYSFYTFESYQKFFKKAHSYQKYFNFERINTHKDHKTPLALLNEEKKKYAKEILNFKPVLLDKKYYDARIKKVA